jgi:hypothetical protein
MQPGSPGVLCFARRHIREHAGVVVFASQFEESPCGWESVIARIVAKGETMESRPGSRSRV